MRRLPASLMLSLVTCAAFAQGRTDYLNVETPQVKPIAVASIADHYYVLACNTPDNSVEVWDTDENVLPADRFVLRIPVGLEPGSVVWSPTNSCLYTTDFLGDSVSCVQLAATGNPSAPLTFDVRAIVNVGDEPVHLGLANNDTELVVVFMSSNTMAKFDAATLQPIGNAFPLTVASPGGPTWALREPRAVVVVGGDAFVIGHKGGHKDKNPANYDFDIAKVNLASGAVTAWSGDLGTTNANLTAGPAGELYVVGDRARNELSAPMFALGAPYGFVESQLHVVRDLGLPTQTLQTHDLNEVAGAPRSKQTAFSGPADVIPFVVGGVAQKLFVASFGTDRIGVVVPDAGPAQGWQVRVIDLVGTNAPLQMGPRGFAYKPRTTVLGHRIYFLNRLANSIGILNPITETIVGTIPLHFDPTPAYVRTGRPFLYDAKLSANGFVACSSCHTDGRTDGLVWDLGDANGFRAPFSLLFADGPARTNQVAIDALVQNGFDAQKGPMVTQSLQGLLNYEAAPDTMSYTTTAPYHWRGDRASFTHFNEAFANLLGLGDQFPGGPTPQGIAPADMQKFEEFANSIHYPPNPHQSPERILGASAMLGLAAFHETPLAGCNNRSCVHCHWLPEGSGNRMTETDGQPLETAALRGLLQKNARLDVDAGPPATEILASTGDSGGIAHDGTDTTVNGFITSTFSADLGSAVGDVRAFVREMDWGVAPVVGRVRMLVAGGSPSDPDIVLMETQAQKANAGVVVIGQFLSGTALVRRNFVYHAPRNLYVEQATGTPTSLTRTGLVSLLVAPQDRLVFESVPLGSELRIASPAGVSIPQTPLAAANVELVPMRANTAYRGIAALSGDWIPVASGGDFAWNHAGGLPTPLGPHAIRLLQHALKTGPLTGGGTQDFGLPGLRHDAPRRFRVAGSNLMFGAVLRIRTPNDTVAPNTSQPADPAKTRLLVVPIHPSNETVTVGSVSGVPVWESALELDPLTYYTMMVGGPLAPGVDAVLTDYGAAIAEPAAASAPWDTSVKAFAFNWHYVSVQNPGQAEVVIGWRRITLD